MESASFSITTETLARQAGIWVGTVTPKVYADVQPFTKVATNTSEHTATRLKRGQA